MPVTIETAQVDRVLTVTRAAQAISLLIENASIVARPLSQISAREGVNIAGAATALSVDFLGGLMNRWAGDIESR